MNKTASKIEIQEDFLTKNFKEFPQKKDKICLKTKDTGVRAMQKMYKSIGRNTEMQYNSLTLSYKRIDLLSIHFLEIQILSQQ